MEKNNIPMKPIDPSDWSLTEEEIRELLSDLNPGQQESVDMFRREGLTDRQIATIIRHLW